MNAHSETDAPAVAGEAAGRDQDMLGAVLKLVPDAVIGTDAEGAITLFNAAAEHIFGRSSASVQGQPVEILIPARLRMGHHEAHEHFVKSGSDPRMMGLRRVKGLRADGQEIDLEAFMSHVNLPQGPSALISMHDVTNRLQADVQLQHSRSQLAELTRKLMTQERVLVKRLAQVLHDQLGQTLAAIRMCHETILSIELAQTPAEYQHLQVRLGSLIGQAIAQVRQVLVDIRPPLLDEQGLCVALDNELRNRALAVPQVDITIHVPHRLELMRWPHEVEYAAFMVVREAVENSLRHSGAGAITVEVKGGVLALDITVADDGVGLPEAAGSGAGHLGILGMQERAQAVGAKVTIGRGQSAGTLVTFHWQCLS
ncbi:PAS domain S-box protein [Rhodoferax sp.]|uniref:sensor histidine kinase n=1 Tax=Rhodoferax sp. TaxID=50421 RepID=UPI0025CC049F|nr:PAS domain S-box protein [Rhodoferax sp.]